MSGSVMSINTRSSSTTTIITTTTMNTTANINRYSTGSMTRMGMGICMGASFNIYTPTHSRRRLSLITRALRCRYSTRYRPSHRSSRGRGLG